MGEVPGKPKNIHDDVCLRPSSCSNQDEVDSTENEDWKSIDCTTPAFFSSWVHAPQYIAELWAADMNGERDVSPGAGKQNASLPARQMSGAERVSLSAAQMSHHDQHPLGKGSADSGRHVSLFCMSEVVVDIAGENKIVSFTTFIIICEEFSEFGFTPYVFESLT